MNSDSAVKRAAILIYGVAAYLVFFCTFCYLALFVANLWAPKTMDRGGVPGGNSALFLNALWILLFGAQHAVMARPAFKRWWTTIIHPAIERSTYVLIASALLILMMWQWRPAPAVIWSAEAYWLRSLLLGISFAGWGLVLYSSFLIDHFDLFGLRQVVLAFRGVPYTQLHFKERSLYRMVRHPLMLGFMIAFWFTPTMTVGHLLFAGVFTFYVLVGIQIEERDLVSLHGDAYRSYRARTSMLVPWPKPVERPPDSAGTAPGA